MKREYHIGKPNELWDPDNHKIGDVLYIPRRLAQCCYPHLIHKCQEAGMHEVVVVIAREYNEGDGRECLVSRYPPVVPMALVQRGEDDIDTKHVGNWLDPVHRSGMILKLGEFKMVELADDLMACLDDIDALIASPVIEEEEKEVEAKPIRIPEGCMAFSDKFGWVPSMGDFPVRVFSDPDAPEVDPYWVWPRKETEIAVWAIENRLPCRMVGPPGGGKTKWYEQFSALTGRYFYRMSCSEALFLEDIIGQTGLKGGETVFEYAELPKVWGTRPTMCVLDEVSRLRPGTFLGFAQRLLEPGNILRIQATGDNIAPHEGSVVCGADNALGVGDNQDKYATANIQDVSTLNRWAVTVNVGYMTEEDMAALIKRHVPAINNTQAKKIAQFGKLCQTAFLLGGANGLTLPFSPRQAIPIAQMAVAFKDVKLAIEYNFKNCFDTAEQAVIQSLIDQVW